VGGGIRDLIQKLDPKDFDIVTNCEPTQIRKIFKNSRIIGRRFKLVHVTFSDEIVETTTFRSDSKDSEGSIEVNEKGRILRDNSWGTQEEDVKRRDFKINSLYYDPFKGEIIDYFGGVKDLDKKSVTFIGDPEKRILEDPVRILRAIRFAAKLNFNIEKGAKKIILEQKHHLNEISPARIYEEVIKLFLSGHAEMSYKILNEYKVFEILFPHVSDVNNEFEDFFLTAFKETDRRHKVGKKLNPGFIFALLMWPKIFKKSNISNKINFRNFYQAISEVTRKQQIITSVPKRFTSFIKDVWMHQPRFQRTGRKTLRFSNNLRFRAAFDFFLLRHSIEPNLKDDIEWWTEFRTANYDKKIKLLNSRGRKFAKS
jgi:poly(A) polymerase